MVMMLFIAVVVLLVLSAVDCGPAVKGEGKDVVVGVVVMLPSLMLQVLEMQQQKHIQESELNKMKTAITYLRNQIKIFKLQ